MTGEERKSSARRHEKARWIERAFVVRNVGCEWLFLIRGLIVLIATALLRCLAGFVRHRVGLAGLVALLALLARLPLATLLALPATVALVLIRAIPAHLVRIVAHFWLPTVVAAGEAAVTMSTKAKMTLFQITT